MLNKTNLKNKAGQKTSRNQICISTRILCCQGGRINPEGECNENQRERGNSCAKQDTGEQNQTNMARGGEAKLKTTHKMLEYQNKTGSFTSTKTYELDRIKGDKG